MCIYIYIWRISTAILDKIVMLHLHTYCNMYGMCGNLFQQRKTNNDCPDPVWKPVMHPPLPSPCRTKRATSFNMSLLRMQSSEGKFTMSREIEPVRRSFCRRGSCTFTEVARLVPSG